MNVHGAAAPEGIVSDRDWSARMIAPETDSGQGGIAPFLATTFVASGPSAPVLHVSAHGLYVVFLNGTRVGDARLTPGWTCYDDRVAYQSYDVAHLLVEGENRIEIWLGDGWYRSPLMWFEGGVPNLWGRDVAAITEIVDGGRVICATGPDWRSGELPVTRNGIYYGEDYDARREASMTADRGTRLAPPPPRLVAQETAPVVELAPVDPVTSRTDSEGRTTYDFGQNIAGYLRFRVRGEAGAALRFEHAEIVGPDGEIDNRNYRTARAELRYVLRGGADENFAPHFTFMGFRYARLTVTGAAEVEAVEAIPISSVPERAGGFECDVPEVDRLVENTVWSQRGNFIDVPTDCPQRDERLGWTGDAQVFAGTACWLADCETFLAKYLRDMRADQRDSGAIPHFTPDTTRHYARDIGDWAGSTGWGDAIAIIPWQLYLHYGRTEVLRDSFAAMTAWVDYVWGLSDGPVVRPHSTWGRDGFTFGDWLQPVGDNRKPRPTIGDDCAATLYHYISTDLVARIAGILGETAVRDRLAERAARIKTAFAHEFFSASGRLGHNDQTSYALAFLHGLVPDAHFDSARAYFRKTVEDGDHLIGTGFIGTPALLPALSRIGLEDVAEAVFLNRRVPGWLYQVEQGATTIWERWDAIGEDGTVYEPSMNSYNHYAYGAVCQWLFEEVAGVRPLPEAPGFDRVALAPTILPGLGKVSMWHRCRHGRIEAGWRIEDGRAIYEVSLPPGCTGSFDAGAHAAATLDGAAVRDGPVEVPPGPHEIAFDLPRTGR